VVAPLQTRARTPKDTWFRVCLNTGVLEFELFNEGRVGIPITGIDFPTSLPLIS